MGASTTTARRSAPPRRPMSPLGVLVGRGVRGVAAVVVAVVWLFLAASYVLPVAAGGSSFTVPSGDTSGVLDEGSLALVRPASRPAIEAGDIVTLRGEGNATHRVLVDNFDGTLVVSSPTAVAETVSARDVEGLVWLHLRDLGAVRDVLVSIPGLAVIIAATIAVGVSAFVEQRHRRRHTVLPSERRATRPSRQTVRTQESAGRMVRTEPTSGQTVRLQVALVVLGDVDDYELRFAMAELGGRVLQALGPRTVLVQLTGTPAGLDAALARLGELAVVDAERRSDVLDLPMPGIGADGSAA